MQGWVQSWSGKIPHAARQLNRCATNTESTQLLKPVCCKACALQQEKPLKWEVWELKIEKTCIQQWRPSIAKIHIYMFVFVQSLSQILICNPTDCSMPASSICHCLPEFAQIHVHWVGNTIRPSHPLLPSSPFALNLFLHQGLFQRVVSSHQVAKVLELQHQSFQWIFRIIWICLRLGKSLLWIYPLKRFACAHKQKDSRISEELLVQQNIQWNTLSSGA